MNWNATSSDIQDTIPRNWLPRNWNSNKSNRTIQLWNLSEGQIMKKQQEYVARVEHLIWPLPMFTNLRMFTQVYAGYAQGNLLMFHSRTSNRVNEFKIKNILKALCTVWQYAFYTHVASLFPPKFAPLWGGSNRSLIHGGSLPTRTLALSQKKKGNIRIRSNY
jgi:hypothetical protein